jgi:hypothetical protein
VTPYSNSGSLLNTADGSHTFACDDLPDSDMQYRLVPDPTRDIDGALLTSVTVEIQDAQNAEIDQEDLPVDPPPGAGKSVDVTVSCEGGNCGATVVTSAGEPGNLDEGSGG